MGGSARPRSRCWRPAVASGCTQEQSERGAITPMSERELSPAPPRRRRLPGRPSLGLRTGWMQTVDHPTAARLVGELRLPELAGQVIVADWRGPGADRDGPAPHLGGVIAFSDVASTRQIRSVNARLRRTAHRPWPLFLAVDQEGGIVQRVRGAATGFPASCPREPRTTSASPGPRRASGAELRGLRFPSTSLPDADVTPDPRTRPSARVGGSDPDLVSEHVVAAAQGYLDAGVLPVLKHFPGHGSVPAEATWACRSRPGPCGCAGWTWSRSCRGRRGPPGRHGGHLDVRARTAGPLVAVPQGRHRPAAPRPGLRAVVTDSWRWARCAARSARSRCRHSGRERRGADAGRPGGCQGGSRQGRASGALPRERLEQAAARQVALLLHQRGDAGAAPGSGRAASRALSAAAATVVAGPCRRLPPPRPTGAVGDPAAVAAFRTAAVAAALAVGRVEYASCRSPRAGRRSAGGVASAPTPVFHGVPVGFAGFGDAAPGGAEVLVATNTPYVWVARQGAHRDDGAAGAMGASVAVLRGDERAPGRLPWKSQGFHVGC